MLHQIVKKFYGPEKQVARAVSFGLLIQACTKVQFTDISKQDDSSLAAASAPDDDSNSTTGNPVSGDPTGATSPLEASPPLIPPPVTPPNPYVPNDPNTGLLPVEGEWASVAYEDNIQDSNAGDRDYNDAVFNYKIAEKYNGSSQLVQIFMEVRLREKLSANNHRLFLILNGDASPHFSNIDHVSLPAFAGEADVRVEDFDGVVVNYQDARAKKILVFENSDGTKGKSVKLQIELKSPELNINSMAHKVVDFKKYRLILQNHGQETKGIDIAEINPSNEMLSNGNHYPFGMMIPTDWEPPAEGQLIDNKYSSFHKYRDWLNGSQLGEMPADVRDWYLLP